MKLKASKRLILGLLVLLLSVFCVSCDLLAAEELPAVAQAPLPEPPWVLPTEREMIAQMAAEAARVEGFTQQERDIVAAAMRRLSAPDYASSADEAARTYFSKITVGLLMPDISVEAMDYIMPEFSGTASLATRYQEAALADYDRMAAALFDGSAAWMIQIGEVTVHLSRASETRFELAFEHDELHALMRSIVDAARRAFREVAEGDEGYRLARALEPLNEIYPVAYALRDAANANEELPWFRSDRMDVFLSHLRVISLNSEFSEDEEVYRLTVMLPEAQSFLDGVAAQTREGVDEMDPMAGVPDIEERFFADALDRPSEEFAYSGKLYEMRIVRKRSQTPERDGPIVVWMGDEIEPHSVSASCVFSPELEEILFAVMGGAVASCAELTDWAREKCYAAWELPKTQAFTRVTGKKSAPLLIEATGIHGYLLRLTPLREDKLAPYRFFIRGGESIEVFLPQGSYRADYTVGEVWLGDELEFGDAGRDIRLPGEPILNYDVINVGYRMTLTGTPSEE